MTILNIVKYKMLFIPPKFIGATIMRTKKYLSSRYPHPLLSKSGKIKKHFRHECVNCSRNRRRLSCFERIELNLEWIDSCLEDGVAWSTIAELLEMQPITLIRHYERLTAKYTLN